jgi:subtilisin family serine protease
VGPDVWELFEDGKADDEVAAIIRLGHHERLPANVRIVSQFSDIVTIRLTRGDLLNVSASAEVLDINAGGSLMGPDWERDSAETLESAPASDRVRETDIRRPKDENATGRGVVIGIVDWGFDFAHPDFKNADGKTRILALWDQRGGKQLNSPAPFGYGVVHDRKAINLALATSDPYAALKYHPADADTGIGCHGTHVASIAAGSGSEERPVGMAPEAQLVLVHNSPWDDSQSGRLGDSVTLLEAIDFIAKQAGERPWVVNLSMGCHADQHDGTTLVEQGLDNVVSAAAGRAVCMSVGNYYNKKIHASGHLRPTEERQFVWTVNERPSDYNQLQIWYSWQDRFDVILRSPDGAIKASAKVGERSKIMLGGVEIGNVYHRGQDANTLHNHANVFLYKEAPAGKWSVTIVGTDVIDGRYNAWIEREVACPPCQSRFVAEDADPKSTTGTICNGRRTIAVGAFDNHDSEHRIGAFSSVGPTGDGRLKPDLCAPGVQVLAARSTPRKNPESASKVTRMSGTSMAAPFATGTVALMFQASPRKLRIEETHNLLLGSARRESVPEENPDRIGIGFVDVEGAVQAARKVAVAAKGFRETTLNAPGVAAKPQAAVQSNDVQGDQENDLSEKVTSRAESESLDADAVDTEITPMNSEQTSTGIDTGLVKLVEQLIANSQASQARDIWSQILRSMGLYDVFMDPVRGRLFSAAESFDALGYPCNPPLRSLLQRYFDLAARAGFCAATSFKTGDILIRRGEGNLAHVAVLAGSDIREREALQAAGIQTAPEGSGYYALVVEGGPIPHGVASGFARRITNEAGCMPSNQLVLRVRSSLPNSEGIDPLSLIVGAGLASSFNRPATAPAAAPSPPASEGSGDAAGRCPPDRPDVIAGFARHTSTVAGLPDTEKAKLDALARMLATNPDSSKNPYDRNPAVIIGVEITGFADNDPDAERREPGYMQRISEERADAVCRDLIGRLNVEKAKAFQWLRVGYGSAYPVVKDPRNERERQCNRRVIVALVKASPPALSVDEINETDTDLDLFRTFYHAALQATSGLHERKPRLADALAREIAQQTVLAYRERVDEFLAPNLAISVPIPFIADALQGTASKADPPKVVANNAINIAKVAHVSSFHALRWFSWRHAKLPQPMTPDCDIEQKASVGGSATLVMCAEHDHVVDTASRTVIAHTLEEYKSRQKAK